ncbi:hypothetical protein V8J88_23525 [Massilia sp. W12]|uniref:hypothetical protein n=1 Tax=Massilia sp. W12 TaxID=3126507 RepID=UPI0030CC7D5A
MHIISQNNLDTAYEQLQSADDAQLLQMLQELEQEQPMLLVFARLGELDGMPPACAAIMGRLALLVHLAMRASGQHWPPLPISALMEQQARLSEQCMEDGDLGGLLQNCMQSRQGGLLALCCNLLQAHLAGHSNRAYAGMMFLSAAAICACLDTLDASAPQ